MRCWNTANKTKIDAVRTGPRIHTVFCIGKSMFPLSHAADNYDKWVSTSGLVWEAKRRSKSIRIRTVQKRVWTRGPESSKHEVQQVKKNMFPSLLARCLIDTGPNMFPRSSKVLAFAECRVGRVVKEHSVYASRSCRKSTQSTKGLFMSTAIHDKQKNNCCFLPQHIWKIIQIHT